jgi:hypothetical protein
MPYICLKFFQRVWIVHIHFFFQRAPQIKVASRLFKSDDRRGHNPQLMTCSLKTLSHATAELFAVCAVALSCIKCPYSFSSSVS